MQRIVIVAGDDVTGSTLQDIFKSLCTPGILTGFELIAQGNQIQVNPGAGLMDSGVFIFNDEPDPTPSVALSSFSGVKEYTVLYRFTASNVLGGNPAVLSIEEGFLNPETFKGGLILGWIRHQGGTQFQQQDIISGRRIRLSQMKEKGKNEFVSSFSPFETKWALVSGSAPAITEGWNPSYNAIITTLANTTPSTMNATYYFPMLIPSTGLGQLLVECEVPNTANLTVSFIDTEGSEYTADNFAWTFIATPMSRKILAIPQNRALASGQMAYIKLAMTLQPGAFVRYKTLGFSSYTEPF